MPSFGERLQKLRRERKWSQDTLAHKIGVARRLISRYETGVSSPSLDTLLKIANAFDVSLDFLLMDLGGHKSRTQVEDVELIRYIEDIKQMDDFDKRVLKEVIQAMILKSKFNSSMGSNDDQSC